MWVKTEAQSRGMVGDDEGWKETDTIHESVGGGDWGSWNLQQMWWVNYSWEETVGGGQGTQFDGEILAKASANGHAVWGIGLGRLDVETMGSNPD
jgi:hypothetical protein